MKKLFICQPLNNKTDEDILQMKKQAIKIAKERLGEKVEIVYDNTPAPKDAKPLWFFGKYIQLLSISDGVFFAEGWRESEACKNLFNYVSYMDREGLSHYNIVIGD